MVSIGKITFYLFCAAILGIGSFGIWYYAQIPKEVEELRVGIYGLGEVDESEMLALGAALEDFYGFETEIIGLTPLPDSAYYEPRDRYKASIILAHLNQIKPNRFDKVIGLTGTDISITTNSGKDWGVFGLAQIGGSSSIVSNFRYREGVSTEIMQERMGKIGVHEIGHTLGLRHCDRDENCLMKPADGRISTIDNLDTYLCTACRADIGW